MRNAAAVNSREFRCWREWQLLWRIQASRLTASDLLLLFHRKVGDFLVGRALVDRQTNRPNPPSLFSGLGPFRIFPLLLFRCQSPLPCGFRRLFLGLFGTDN